MAARHRDPTFYRVSLVEEGWDQLWIVDEVVGVDDTECLPGALTSGRRLHPSCSLTAAIHTVGEECAFSMNIDMVPIVDTRLAREIEALDPLGVEWLDVSIAGTETAFRAMNVLRVLDCLDRAASGVRWTTRPNGERAERPIIERLAMLPARIQSEAHAFRLDLSPSMLFFSEQLVDLVSRSGISNAKFNPVDVR